METTDEWTLRTIEEELDILYLDWESWYDAEFEHLTIPVCFTCGNALQGLTWMTEGVYYFH